MADAERRVYAPENSATFQVGFDSKENGPVFRHRSEVVRGLESFVAQNLSLLKPLNKIWEPSDLIPVDFTRDGWQDQVQELQRMALNVPDEVFSCLVPQYWTEDALPSYLGRLDGQFDALRDRTGTDDTPWAKWNRGWTAEEQGHGKVIGNYLLLSGRVNMHVVDEGSRRLVANGFNMEVEDPYEFIWYTIWQEVATGMTHNNTANKAKSAGDPTLNKICTTIAGDEGRHAEFYLRVGREIFRQDPVGAMLSFWNKMKNGVVMPTERIDDGISKNAQGLPDIFKRYADLANSIGIFTAKQIASIWTRVIKELGIEHIKVTGPASEAQEHIFKRLGAYQRIGETEEAKRLELIINPGFSWTIPRVEASRKTIVLAK